MDRRVALEALVPWSTSPGLRTTVLKEVPTDSRPPTRRGQRVSPRKAFSPRIRCPDRRNTSPA
jgi:hypothetical protein